MKKLSYGFSLVELLVVIAIIAILGVIALAAFGGARDKGKDAGIQAILSQVRNEATLYYIENQTLYLGPSSNVCQHLTDKFQDNWAEYIDPGSAIAAECAFAINGSNQWATETQLNSGDVWCADYTGFIGPVKFPTGNRIKQPAPGVPGNLVCDRL